MFLAREGLSFATLKRMPEATQPDVDVEVVQEAEPARALAAPSSLKGVLSAREAAAALAEGFAARRSRVHAAPVADGGEGRSTRWTLWL